ncbi:M48 family metallopeptidase [Thalassobacillus hwangdonensis]|uniref:M48 family metallopeptidase n=1 Tax=Thalassobacillus hwangdonensis TaxID=546108 RepID=A0ABW3L2A4_9BACI
MKKRFVIWAGLLFAIYATLMGFYLLSWADFGVPDALKGTGADPATFMSERELELSAAYSRYQVFVSFVAMPYEWIIYIGVLVFGASALFRNTSEKVSRFTSIQVPIYVLFLSILTWVLTFPIDFAHRWFSVEYGISNQTFSGWMRDQMISFWLSTLITALLITALYLLIRKFPKRWWLFAWMGLIPFLIFMMYIQPVVIDPLYNDFYELQDKELETKILALADEADIPAERVYEVNMSEKTNAMNAYVNGIGDNLRIVLWDTTLNGLEDREVLFIMAHEIGHYVMNHLYWNLFGAIASSLVLLYLGYRLIHVVLRKWGDAWGVRGIDDIASLPALLLVVSLLSFVSTPAELAISRNAEKAADTYAIEMLEDKEAAVGSFQKLAVNGLSDVNPPALVKFFQYGHPTLMERIKMLENYEK